MWRHYGWHDLKRPTANSQGHSFWYQSISHIRLYFKAVNSNFWCRTHRLATIHFAQTRDKQMQHSSISATVSTVGWKQYVYIKVLRTCRYYQEKHKVTRLYFLTTVCGSAFAPVGIPYSSICVQALYYSMLYCTVEGTKRFCLLRF